MTEPTSPPPIDRELLSRDLIRLGHSIAVLADRRLPAPLKWALQRSGVDLSRVSSEISSHPLALDDGTLALLIDALAIELGAIRGVRAPLEVTPELEAAFARLRAVVV
ncbi:MAG: globin family protein [Myxococcales bacterium]